MTPTFVTKILKNLYFYSAKMVPQEVVLFLTLEVVPKLTLERPKSGTKTNSPAYIYIYIIFGDFMANFLGASLLYRF